nr:PREDICTED: uncharacterized protein LOC109039764 isoform X2 [Bemisia tabaci]XP_018910959.1 PREDICTED: uncharacterized protein LOC109039764 isoform X2 [Bemisia tabaci]XP_018910960.1 PREDICTED: uncharacterized protein LOC109039764 isoform X2 [Bemisia tabaci]XP_018910962.1 PREDICTED: uncharacterized protein LOC109039764 isoform X2 [Bemisia tabaci]
MHCQVFGRAKLTFKPFDGLRDGEIFVDKTFLIQKFLSGRSRHMLVTAPRGSGKSTCLDMVRKFAEIDVFANGTMKTDKCTHKNYKMFAEIVPSSGKFLNTFRRKKFFEKHFGEYPVIFLNLDMMGVKTYDRHSLTQKLLTGPIKAAFEDHSYLLKSPLLSSHDKDRMTLFLNPTQDILRAHFQVGSGPREGIGLLKRLLKQHFQRDTIALIDNMDSQLQELIFDPKQHSDRSMEKLFEVGDILRALPDWDLRARAEPTYRTLAMGVLQPFHASKLYKYFPRAYDELMDTFFVLTDVEVTTLLRTMALTHYKENIKAWYGGFHASNAYNPFSVFRFLAEDDTKEFRPYWTELVPLEVFKPTLRPECFGQHIMLCLRKGEFPESWWNPSQFWMDYGHGTLPNSTILLQDLQNPSLESRCTNGAAFDVLNFLNNCGYLSYEGLNIKRATHTFRVPNLEVRQYLKKLLFDAIAENSPCHCNYNFRVDIFKGLTGIDGMRKFTETLITLLVLSEHHSQPNRTKELFAHTVRVHLLNPPPQCLVPYVKTGPSDQEWETEKPSIFDLVFVAGNKKVGFAVKVQLGGAEPPARVSSTEGLLTFESELQNEVENVTKKVIANLWCGETWCVLSYSHKAQNDKPKCGAFRIEKRNRWQPEITLQVSRDSTSKPLYNLNGSFSLKNNTIRTTTTNLNTYN